MSTEITNILSDINTLLNIKNNINELLLIIMSKLILNPQNTQTNKISEDIMKLIDDQINTIKNGDFYLFSYGSFNHDDLLDRLSHGMLRNLSQNEKKTYIYALDKAIWDNSVAAYIKSMTRGFFGFNPPLHGPIATIIPIDTINTINRDYVRGIALRITKTINNTFKIGNFPVNFWNLVMNEVTTTDDKFNQLYELGRINNLTLDYSSYKTEVNTGYAFIGKNITKYPSLDVVPGHFKPLGLNYIAKLLKYRRLLLTKPSTGNIKLNVIVYTKDSNGNCSWIRYNDVSYG